MAGIRAILAGSPFHGKGYRKIRARLAHRGLPVSGKRVLRLMRQHGLLAPRRLGPPNGDPAHAGTIITDRPDVMWGTDATRFYTEREGWCWFFGAIDHGIDELLGWHVAKLGDRWAALEPIRQGVRHAFGAFRKDVSPGASRSAATGALLEPLERLERLAALVPPPRRPLLAYHGRLAPRSRWRAAIVPKAAAEAARADAAAALGAVAPAGVRG